MNVHHKRALAVLSATAMLDVFLGVLWGMADNASAWHGIYCATGTATTVGCDLPPVTAAGYVISFLEMLTIVPLFASVFAFFTTGLTASHIDVRHGELKDQVTR